MPAKKNWALNCDKILEPIFKDLKVIELAGVLAGPSAGLFFAELGAKVIKVENPKTGGDVTRTWKLKTEEPEEPGSAYFWSVNAFKEFVSLDLSTQKGLEILYDLVKTADVVIANYKKGDAEKLKVDYTTLKKLQPKLIYASITGFGDTVRSAYDLILQAESGFMSMNGEPNSNPLKMPVALIDILAGHHLKEAILLSLLKLYKQGEGSHVSVSLFDSAVASLANQATNWLIAGHLPKATGSLHPNIAPYGELFETKDKQKITFAIGSNKQFKHLCEIIRYKQLAADPRFALNQGRVSNRAELYALLYDYVRQLSFKELYAQCLEFDVPIGKIRDLKEVFELPEAQAMLREISDGKKKIKVVSGTAIRFEK